MLARIKMACAETVRDNWNDWNALNDWNYEALINLVTERVEPPSGVLWPQT